MAQVVLIDTGTLRADGSNSIGDVVSIHDDNVFLSPPSYEGFKIIVVPGTAQEVVDLLNSKIPEIKSVFRTKVSAGEWTDEPPEEKEVWNDNGTWKKVEKRPKYQVNLLITPDVKDSLEVAEKEDRDFLLVNAALANITAKAENQTSIAIAKIAVEDVIEEAKA